jgi:hypothetical protein
VTTSDNIKWAKNQFNDHCAEHKCLTGECDRRRELWLEYMGVAEQWGNLGGDSAGGKDRQR